MYDKLKPYLHKRGLTLAEDKTKITEIKTGFDFLGYNIRKYETKDGMKLLIKPSKASIKKAKQTIKERFNNLRGKPIGTVIRKLNPIIRGIGNYWSSVVAKKVYSDIDNYVYLKITKHLRQLHPLKSRNWKNKQYLKQDFTGVSNQKIVTDPHNARNQLIKMSWIPIERHILITYKNSPDDATLKEYFTKRDEKEFARFNILSKRKIAKNSGYKCRVCDQSLVGDEEIINNRIVPKELGGQDIYSNLEILHKNCFDQHYYLLNKYGGGRDFPRIQKFFNDKDIDFSSKEGISLMKREFKRFKYNCSR
jgi:RNA-directed DNA polymerase